MSSYKFAYFSVPEKQKDRYLTFVDDYYNFIGENPESKYRRRKKMKLFASALPYHL